MLVMAYELANTAKVINGLGMIQVRDLQKSFGSNKVLQDITLQVDAGEIFGIVGHSGAGKSTLLRCLNGLESYDSGIVTVMGQEVGSLSQAGLLKLRSKMGMIFQTFSLMDRRNVYDNVAFPLEIWKHPKNIIKDRVMELLQLVGLEDKYKSRPSSLSGGQKQRVGIARALALNPSILLSDEATSALDPRTTMSILDLLQNINERLNLTIVLVTHQMEVVKRLCKRTLLLDGGITQGIGDTANLFLAPTEKLKKLIEDEYTLIPSGANIRLIFPRELSQQHVITTMARELDIDFSIAGGKLERYQNDILGFLIINVKDEHLEMVLKYLRKKELQCQVVDQKFTRGNGHE
jgi:D-methionine transport system ATP-binding protein